VACACQALGTVMNIPGSADPQDVICPSGYTVSVTSSGNPTCLNEAGGSLPPLIRPAKRPLSIMDWSILASLVFVVGASAMSES